MKIMMGRIRVLFRRFVLRLPKTPFFDLLHHTIFFFVAHGRLPKRDSGLVNDYFFFLKTSSAIEDVARQFTSDKLFVKDWISIKVGTNYTPKTLKTFDRPSQISIEDLPQKCVVKPTHLSALVVFIDKSKNAVTADELAKLKMAFCTNIYDISRERNYRRLRPRVICEEALGSSEEIIDYKVFCFGGIPRLIQVDVGRHSTHRRSVYTTDWKLLDITYNKPRAGPVDCPKSLEKMLTLSESLSLDFESVRIDFYDVGGRVYIGELTHCPEQAHGRFGSLDEERLFSALFFGNSKEAEINGSAEITGSGSHLSADLTH